MTSPQPEVWLRGAVPGVIPLLQPVAHALLQTAEDLPPLLLSLSIEQFRARPGGSASIGYHAIHLAGSLDRLFTYARGEPLSEAQRAALAEERGAEDGMPPIATVVARLEDTLRDAVAQLQRTSAETLLGAREVGRGRLPSTVLGLLFHGAEHSTRHAGQIATLARVVGAV
ncbi:MAG TPA: DinB family protein [Gemmatimonadales bacterium]|nr:DinB family protein [Gemmatimonadales bacterium]